MVIQHFSITGKRTLTYNLKKYEFIAKCKSNLWRMAFIIQMQLLFSIKANHSSPCSQQGNNPVISSEKYQAVSQY